MEEINLVLLYLSVSILSIALILCSIKIFMHTNVFSKLVAVDVATNIVVVYIALFALIKNQIFYLDISTAIVLIAFLATIAYAKFMYWRKNSQ